MFHALGRFAARRARAVLILSGLMLAIFAVVGVGAFGRLLSQGFDNPSSASSQAADLVDQKFGGDPDIVFLVHARQGVVDDPAVASDGQALADRLGHDSRLSKVTSYWPGRTPGLESKDRTYALILAHVNGDDQQAGKASPKIVADYSHIDTAATTVRIGGAQGADIGGQVGKDIRRAELIAVPITIVLLILAFGSVVASLLPLAIGGIAIFGAFAELDILTHATSVSVFAINIVTALGLGLGVDYALLMVSRFREELQRTDSVEDAVARSVATAGRTIAFSALTVTVALAAMLVFPVYFLKSFAYGGVGVTLFAAIAATLTLPALLAVLGPRVNSGAVPWVRPRQNQAAHGWGRLAAGVMRRPVIAAVPVVAALLVAALPLLNVTFGTPDVRALPPGAPSHQVGDVLAGAFATQPTTIDVLVTGPTTPAVLAGYARRLSSVPGVQRDDSPAGSFAAGAATAPAVRPSTLSAGSTQRIVVATSLYQTSDAAQDLVRDLRATAPPVGVPVLVGGPTARLIDDKQAIGSRLWLAALIIAVTSFVLLFLFTGSIWQPVRALVGNALTLGASLGAMVWIFQDGHLSSLLGFTPAPTNADMPVLLFCVAFGLSMDYEVFVISRIKEQHDAGATNADAVVHGLSRTGRIVSTAAALLAVSFFAFGTSHVSFIQFFGLGNGLAILVDATLVRGILVPAFMRLLGERSWYAPHLLRRLHTRLKLDEGAPIPALAD